MVWPGRIFPKSGPALATGEPGAGGGGPGGADTLLLSPQALKDRVASNENRTVNTKFCLKGSPRIIGGLDYTSDSCRGSSYALQKFYSFQAWDHGSV
jgi:hypothetical protein